MLVYYEELIANEQGGILDVLRFMNITPAYFQDYMDHKEEYKRRVFESYRKQHEKDCGGKSSIGEPKPIFYSLDVRPGLLELIDEYIIKIEPDLWERYLKRFATVRSLYD